MINKVSFMGREECLTKPAKKVVTAADQYFKPGEAIGDAVKETKKLVSEFSTEGLDEAMKAKFMPLELPKKTDAVNLEAIDSYVKSHENV